jgi:hypothetical protein
MKKQGIIKIQYNKSDTELTTFKIENVRSKVAVFKWRLRRLKREAEKLSGFRRDIFVAENGFIGLNKAIEDGEFILSHVK